MRIIRGKHAGHTAAIRRFCNDWISADRDDGPPIIVSPVRVQIENHERPLFVDDGRHGSFFAEFRLESDGTFTALTPDVDEDTL